MKKEKNSIYLEYNIISSVAFDQSNVSLLHKSINFLNL